MVVTDALNMKGANNNIEENKNDNDFRSNNTQKEISKSSSLREINATGCINLSVDSITKILNILALWHFDL